MSDAKLVSVKRHTHVGTDSKGRDITLLAFSPEETAKLVETINEIYSSGQGVLFRIAAEERVSKTGNKFLSSFALVMADLPKGAPKHVGGGDFRTPGAGAGRVAVKPKTYGTGTGTSAKPNGTIGGAYKPALKQNTVLIEEEEGY